MKHSRELKEDVVVEISQLLCVAPPRMSTGSTEPKELFHLIYETLGFGVEVKKSKPNMARDLVIMAGLVWDPDCESRGSTVTYRGLTKVREAVQIFLKTQA
jgi:hypothetical protein